MYSSRNNEPGGEEAEVSLNLTAARIALDVMDGAEVSGLGIFEQGFYDKLGFGTGGYEHIINFPPSALKIDLKPRVPCRLTVNDWQMVHKSRLNRLRVHGSCNFESPAPTQAEMNWSKNGFGFGYFNDEGELTHHIWMKGKGKEYGPFHIEWMVYRNYEQFLELLALLRSFGEQIHLISMIEPPHVQFQDFLERPLQLRRITEKSDYQNSIKALAYWQMRICNLEACMKKTHLKGADVRFNLVLKDPIADFLDGDFEWKGISGDYIINLGIESHAERGSDDTVPTMHASVGAFTRMWLGVSSATVLSVSDNLSAPVDLLRQLDDLLRLPHPTPDWEL